MIVTQVGQVVRKISEVEAQANLEVISEEATALLRYANEPFGVAFEVAVGE